MFREFRRRCFDSLFLAAKQECGFNAATGLRQYCFLAPSSRNASRPYQPCPSLVKTQVSFGRIFSDRACGGTGSITSEDLKEVQNPASVNRVNVASHILQQVAARKLNQYLKQEGQVRLSMPLREAVAKAKELGAAHGDEEAQALINALHVSGDVLRHEHKLYLKPEEVAEIVLKALPDTEEEAQAKLREIDAELEPMRRELHSIEYRAQMRSTMLAYAGLGLLCCQFALFLRLTYWELSWDVMEPVSYFAGQLIGIMMYAYFLVYKHDFTYEQASNRYIDTEKFKLIEQSKFDYERYHRLIGDANRWKRFSRSLSRR